MKRNVGLGLLIFATSFISAQTKENVFEVEYQQNNLTNKGIAFSVNNCEKEIVYETWKTWAKNKNGKYSFFKKYEITDLQFKNTDNLYDNKLNIVEDSTNFYTVINTFKDQNGLYLKYESKDYDNIYQRVHELVKQTNKNCLKSEIFNSNTDIIKLSKNKLSFEVKLNEMINLNYSSYNNFLASNEIKNSLTEKLDLIDHLITNSDDGFIIDRLIKQKNELEIKLNKVNHDIFVSSGKQNLAKKEIEFYTKEINKYQIEIQSKKRLIDSLTNNFERITL